MISFTWNAVDNVTYYWLQVSTNPTVESNYVVNTSASTWTNYAYTSFPDDGTMYYWRVFACNDEGCSYSTTWSLKNGPSAPPGSPSLLSPSNNIRIDGSTATFDWTSTARATSYHLQIAYDTSFDNIRISQWDSSSSATVTSMPDNGKTYFWRACAYNSKGETCSSYSTIISGPSAVPAIPTLTYPDSGLTVNDFYMAFWWDSAARAANYYLQIATDSLFSDNSTAFGQWTGDDIPYYYVNGLLNNGQKYYWRVAAGNSKGTSNFSDVRWFTYDDSISPCTLADGSGYGVLATQDHIATCRQDSGGSPYYYLYDISRRGSGRMASTNAIKTKVYYNGYMPDDDNSWVEPYPDYKTAVDAHVYAGKVYEYLHSHLQLNSYDGSGLSMVSAVEMPCYDDQGKLINNAFWYDKKVTYCIGVDNNGVENSLPYSGTLDVVAHEWGHAVTSYASSRGANKPLIYSGQSGALNEAFSDWMGTAVEHYYSENNWTIGEGISTDRDLSDPPLHTSYCVTGGVGYDQPQPDHMSGYIACSNDTGGVHLNSGIPNKMFYLLSQGGTQHIPWTDIDVTVQGIGIEKAMKVAYRANMRYWPADATFQKSLEGMIDAANEFYYSDPNIAYQIQNAWAAVGVGTLPMIGANTSPVEGGTVCGEGSYEWGASVTVTATAAPGYTFVNWTENDSQVSPSASYTFPVNGSRTLTANFAVTTSAGNITYTSSSFINTYVGEQSPPTTFTVKNSGMASFAVSNVSITGDNPQDFTISNTGSQDYCGGKTLTTFASCSVQVKFAPQSAGSKAATLNIQSNAAVNSLLSSPLSGMGETPPTYIITATAGSGGTISPSGSVSITHGQSQAFTTTPNTGYHITSVTGCGGTLSGNTYTTGAITANCTVTASFAINTYTVTPFAGANGSISPLIPQTVNYGSTTSFTLAPNTGYHIELVTGCGGTLSGNTYTTGAITADCTVTASFSGNTYTLSIAKSGGSGTVTSLPVGINCGTVCSDSFSQGMTVTLTAVPSQGYTFTGWSGVEGGACSGNGECVLTVNENKSITAVFSQVSQPLDLAFVIDSTGSMWDDIDKVKASAVDIINKIGADVSDYRIAVVDYKDHPISPYGDPSDYPYRAVLPFSKDTTAIVNAINSLTASGGADWPESVYSALINTFNAKDLGSWRPEAKKAIILMGDAPPHDPEPVTGYTLNSVIEASYSIASPYASKAGALRATALNPMGTDISTAPVMIYSIVVGSDNNALEYFTKLSEGTEGKVFTVATSDDVVGGVMDAIDEITTPANKPPICSSSTASTQEIWPPNHNMKSVSIINVADPDGDPVTIIITGISQDEPVKGTGSGNTAPDAEGIGSDTAKVRAERTGSINGRVYKISFAATDDKGLQCTGYVMTCVPHDQGENNVCVDDGQLYDSIASETEVSLPGNIDVAGPSANRVDGYDLIKLSIAFGSKTGDLNWNPSCDLDKNGASNNKIDGTDLIVLGNHFGKVKQ